MRWISLQLLTQLSRLASIQSTARLCQYLYIPVNNGKASIPRPKERREMLLFYDYVGGDEVSRKSKWDAIKREDEQLQRWVMWGAAWGDVGQLWEERWGGLRAILREKMILARQSLEEGKFALQSSEEVLTLKLCLTSQRCIFLKRMQAASGGVCSESRS